MHTDINKKLSKPILDSEHSKEWYNNFTMLFF